MIRPPRSFRPGECVPAAEWQRKCVDLAWALADGFMLTDGPLFVTVQLIVVDLDLPPVRRTKVFLALVAAVRQWAKTLNVSHTYFHVTTGANLASTDRLMKAAGAKLIGGGLCGLNSMPGEKIKAKNKAFLSRISGGVY